MFTLIQNLNCKQHQFFNHFSLIYSAKRCHMIIQNQQFTHWNIFQSIIVSIAQRKLIEIIVEDDFLPAIKIQRVNYSIVIQSNFKKHFKNQISSNIMEVKVWNNSHWHHSQQLRPNSHHHRHISHQIHDRFT